MKKILVRVPSRPEEIIGSFPFFHQLKILFPDDQLNAIVDQECLEIVKYLPFALFSYPFPREKDTLLGIHHFCYNLIDVFNIDIFFDLQNTLKSAFMGFAFGSRERIGYCNGLNKFFLTKQIPAVLEPISLDRKLLKILEIYTEQDFREVKVMGEVDCLVEGLLAPYIVVIFDKGIGDPQREKDLIELFNLFEEQSFMFWCDLMGENLPPKREGFTDEEKSLDQDSNNQVDWEKKPWKYLEDFISKLNQKNKYEIVKGKNFKQLIQLISACKGVITDQSWRASLSSYFAVDACLLTWQAGQFILKTDHFKSNSIMADFTNEKSTVKLHDGEGAGPVTLNGLVDYLYKRFVL